MAVRHISTKMSTGVVLGRFVLRPLGPLGCLSRRGISGKALRDPTYKRPTPWPYKEKKFTFAHGFFLRESTTDRMDENSKIIVVDGPIASGKGEVAKKLAEELDMMFMPDATLDDFYVNSYGFDLRKLNAEMPESFRSFDIVDFHKNPNHKKVATMQILMYKMRYQRYIQALGHMLSTGQGVVIDRSCYSDSAFTEAMFRNNYLSKEAYGMYHDIKDNTTPQLFKPHLIVYLDVPVATTLQNIKKKASQGEKETQVYTEKYLATMEEVLKNKYLKELSPNSELLVYDWSSHGDVEVVVEDIERLNFDNYETEDPKLEDWRSLVREWDWHLARYKFAHDQTRLLTFFNVPSVYAPELFLDGDEAWIYQNVLDSAPGGKFAEGYNADQGDKNIMLK